ncbi:MAG: ABC transporter ATP-binding protein [Aquabacterium sp.]
MQPAQNLASRATAPPMVRLRGVDHCYPLHGGQVQALRGLSLQVRAGEFVAVVGPSGSGKSTLLNVLAGIDRPTQGEVVVGGHALQGLSERALSRWRGTGVGIVFQFFQLLPTLTAAENVMLPMDFADRWPRHERPERARQLLDKLGVADQAEKFPAALSGGQQQRVAVARALANAPPLVLADEPTGNLDSHNAAALLDLLAGLVRDDGLTVMMVTHERDAMRHATRTLHLVDGQLREQADA